MFDDKIKLYLMAMVAFLVGLFLIYESISSEKSFPKYTDLLFAEGELIGRVTGGERSIYFSLAGWGEEFQYVSNQSEINKARKLTEVGSVVRVSYIRKKGGRKSVYDLEIDERKVRSYEEVRASHKSNNRWRNFLALLMILGACLLFREANVTEN